MIFLKIEAARKSEEISAETCFKNAYFAVAAMLVNI
jgi:hypothetical protein